MNKSISTGMRVLLILVISIVSMATASAGAYVESAHQQACGKYENPPALIYRLDTSPDGLHDFSDPAPQKKLN
jgi:hypothetical protein